MGNVPKKHTASKGHTPALEGGEFFFREFLMKNTFKFLGILLIITATVFILACGGDPQPSTYTVKFDADGGKPAPGEQTLNEGDKISQPTQPKKDPPEGLYRVADPTCTFLGWYNGEDKWDFSTPVSGSITLKAKWEAPTAEPIGTTDDIFTEAVKYINKSDLDPALSAEDKWTLCLANNVEAKAAVTIAKNNTDLTIKNIGGEKTITSPDLSDAGTVFLTIGPPSGTASNIKVTLSNVGLRGIAGVTPDEYGVDQLNADGKEVANSLVRVQFGATLVLDKGSSVKGHISSSNDSDGKTGNGSAVCVYGGKLTMEEGATIEANKSTQTTTSYPNNRNRVGGVYTIKDTSGNTPTLEINGGQVVRNDSPTGNTKDVYATEGGTFIMKGYVKIDEITLNGESNGDFAVITVSGLSGPSDDPPNVGLSLRSTAGKSTVGGLWNTKQVLQSDANGTAPDANDAQYFHLKDYKGNDGNDAIQAGSIEASGKYKNS